MVDAGVFKPQRNTMLHEHDMCSYAYLLEYPDARAFIEGNGVRDITFITDNHTENINRVYYAGLCLAEDYGCRIGNTNFYDSEDLYDSYWRNETIANELSMIIESMCNSPEVCSLALISFVIKNYYADITQQPLYRDVCEDQLQISLRLNSLLCTLYFNPEKHIAGNLFHKVFAEHKSMFTSSLIKIANACGLVQDSVTLLLSTEGNTLYAVNLADDVTQNINLSLPNPHRSLWSLAGPDGVGKSSVLETLQMFHFPISYPNNTKVLQILQNLPYGNLTEALVQLEEIINSYSQAKQDANILEIQHSLVATRNLISSRAALPTDQLTLTPWPSWPITIMERGPFCNLAYAANVHDFLNKLESEFKPKMLLPEMSYVLDVPISVAYQRSVHRNNTDIFDNAAIDIHKTRKYRYLMLANKLPQFLTMVSTVAYTDRKGVPHIRTLQQISDEIRQKILSNIEN